MRARALGVLIFAVAFVAASAAPARDRYFDAERLAAKGRLLIRIGQLDAGAAAFRAAREINPDPRYLLEEARTLDEAGHDVAAIAGYQRFLDASGEGCSLEDEGRRHLDALKERVARTHVEVRITADPPNAEAFLDTSESPLALPYRAWLPVGKHVIVAHAPGHTSTKVELTLSPGAALQAVPLTLPPEAKKSTLVVRGAPAGASVLLDGVKRCTLPCDVPLEPGAYLLRVEADGVQPAQELIRLRSGETVELEANLGADQSGIEHAGTAPGDQGAPETPAGPGSK